MNLEPKKAEEFSSSLKLESKMFPGWKLVWDARQDPKDGIALTWVRAEKEGK